MSTLDQPPDPQKNAGREETLSVLFANMVIQQSNLALLLLGKVPHPESGELRQDLDAAQMLIDQLEMIEVKTKGNLNKQEEQLLKQSLTTLRMAFVEAVDQQGVEPRPAPPAAAAAEPAKSTPPSGPAAPSPAEADSRKKFSKKY
ncbi:MAG: DUF1844 domain-containing protein [Chloroflexi bacterium]|nr:DUF1844 domain-containing protein [Chloroflexota bacterium]